MAVRLRGLTTFFNFSQKQHLICLILWSLVFSAKGNVCPHGWIDYTNSSSCYLLTDYQVRYGFDMAIDRCKAHDADLISIDSKEEWNWLINELDTLRSSSFIPPKMAWWVGLEDKGQGQGVTYVNGSNVDLSLFSWSDGQIPSASKQRRCVAFANDSVLLSDCMAWRGLVCERSKDAPLHCDVGDGWVYINGSCFKYYTRPATWYSAKGLCEAEKAELAKIDTLEEMSYVWDETKLSSSTSWIGLKSDDDSKSYKWLDGSVVDSALTWWMNNQPQDLSKLSSSVWELCGLILGSNTKRLSSWVTRDCKTKNPFTCRKPKGYCADGWISQESTCVKFFSKYEVSWSTARNYCQALGGDLLVIPSESYQDMVNEYLEELKASGVDSLWIGLQDVGDSAYSWVDNTSTADWSNWAASPPDNVAGEKDVAYISTADPGGKWQVTTKSFKFRSFGCSMSNLVAVRDVPPPIPDYKCETGWQVAGDSCVMFSTEEVTWKQAEIKCAALVAQLAVVNSVDAQSFFDNRVTTGQYWIGLQKSSQDSEFTWTNGTNLEQANWAIGQPDYQGDNQTCVIMKAQSRGAKWYDMACQQLHTYICQKSPLNTEEKVYDDKPDPAPAAPIDTESARCGDGWEIRTGTDWCYQFKDKLLNWTEAINDCQNNNGSLVSITSRDEQSYIEGRLGSLTSQSAWIGATDQDQEAGWNWVDGAPFAFLNWHAGEPNNFKSKEDCAAINENSMQWYDFPCSLHLAYVCKKRAAPLSTTPPPVTQPTVIPSGMSYGCPSGWLGFEDSCYLIKTFTSTWLDAQMACRIEQSELASIGSVGENDFVWSQLNAVTCKNTHSSNALCQSWADQDECHLNPAWMSAHCQSSCGFCNVPCTNKHTDSQCVYWASIGECQKNPGWMFPNCALSCGCNKSINIGYWIGLNDRQVSMTYVWSNLSPVTYTYWMNNEPSNYGDQQEDCVKLHQTTGEWSDEECDSQVAGYICESPKRIMDTPTIGPDQVGCPIGNMNSFGYGHMCYMIIDDLKTWVDAQLYCAMKKANLATIPDSITNALLTSEIVQKSSSYWIGLSDKWGTYSWDSGVDIQFLPWAPSHTGNENNTCVGIRSQKPVGLWENLNCQDPHPFICEIQRRGFTAPVTTTTPGPTTPTTPAPCPDGWSGKGDHCFQMFFDPLPWFEAQAACELYAGSLASIHDYDTNTFINDLTQYKVTGGYWIGLTDMDAEKSWMWSDLSPFGYDNWKFGEPNSASPGEDCVEADALYGQWNDNNCYLAKPYVCSIVRGVPLPTIPPTASTTEAPTCQDSDWLAYNGYCYYISPNYGDESVMNWYEARRKCMGMGGELASVASDGENNFLTTELSKRETRQFWIGLNQLGQESYKWSDGSPPIYIAWAKGEPNDGYGGERCVDFAGDRGLWVDDDCMTQFGYVCKKINSSVTPKIPIPTPIIPGYCPGGFLSEGVTNKCYYIGGKGNTSTGDPPLAWEDARDACRKLTSPNLVDIGSIHSLIDQDFVTILLSQVPSDLWIGFSDLHKTNEYHWQDNSEVTFTNWASDKPGTHSTWTFLGTGNENCVKMLRKPSKPEDVAKWSDASCNDKNPYLCETVKVKSSPSSSSTTSTVDPSCPSGFFKFRSACYSIITQAKTWDEALSSCKFFNGDLASTSDIFEVARMDLELYNHNVVDQAWIGLRFDSVTSQYVWSDKWPLINTFWSEADPDQQNSDSCVALKQASWNDTSCTEQLPYICEIKNESPPTPPPTPRGHCADPSHKIFGDFCYLAKPDEALSWPEANYKCAQMGMQLASVHSEEENQFILDIVKDAGDSTFSYSWSNIWIGLHRGMDNFVWSDDSSINYFNWDDGEPTSVSDSEKYGEEDCVEIYKDSGKWNDLPCIGQSLGYVCKTFMIFPTTLPTTAPTTARPATRQFLSGATQRIPPVTQNNHNTQNRFTYKPPSRQNSHAPDDGGLSGGQIAGIVIGVLGAGVIAAVVVIVIRRRYTGDNHSLYPKGTVEVEGYDNALYVQNNGETGESNEEVKLGHHTNER